LVAVLVLKFGSSCRSRISMILVRVSFDMRHDV
jgi:hypothetical protein